MAAFSESSDPAPFALLIIDPQVMRPGVITKHTALTPRIDKCIHQII